MKTTTNTENEPTITWVLETKFKDLTDEEIGEVYETLYEMKLLDEYPLKFARAILKKAQEK